MGALARRARAGGVTAWGATEGERCCARIGRSMPAFATRKGERCTSRASGVHELQIRGDALALPVCQVHLKMLRVCADPAALVRSWAR
jgi:hypothetical protein